MNTAAMWIGYAVMLLSAVIAIGGMALVASAQLFRVYKEAKGWNTIKNALREHDKKTH